MSLLIIGCSNNGVVTQQTDTKPSTTLDEKKIRQEVSEYFDLQKQGHKQESLKNYNACRNYEIVSLKYYPGHSVVRQDTVDVNASGEADIVVRVECSDVAGHPIVVDSYVRMYKGESNGVWYFLEVK